MPPRIVKASNGDGVVRSASSIQTVIEFPNDATKYLDGTGAYTVPAGSGSGTVTNTGTLTANRIIKGNGGVDITVGDLTGDVTTAGSMATTLANTAVTPGSYTSANITVDAKGRLTAAANGAGTGAVTLISTQILVGDASTVTFSSISGSYTHLQLVCYGRLTEATAEDYIWLRMNGDTGNNYDHYQFFGTNSTTSSASVNGTSRIRIGDWTAASASTSDQASMSVVFIPAYTSTAFNKVVYSSYFGIWGASAATTGAGTFGGQWRSLSAITDLTVLGAANDIKSGSVFSLYGIT